jgi:glycosyltransferase involved in cell wall biosynthesis
MTIKIAVIGPKGLPPKQGGIEHYCAEFYPRLVEEGCVVDLYARASYTGQSWYSQSNFNGVQVISLPSIPIRGIDALTSSGLAVLSTLFKNYDIIHFHALGPAVFSGVAKLCSRAKVVVTCHGLDWQRAKWGKSSSRLIKQGERSAIHYADEIIVVSKSLQDYFRGTYGQEISYIPTAPATYLGSDPNFAYLRSLGLQQGKYALFLGRLVPEKRPDLLIEAFQSLQPHDWKLVFIGGDSDALNFNAHIKRLSVNSPQILFPGELRGRRLAELVRGAGLFVLPSDLEGLPLAMLEAMLEKVPVVASDIPPHRQLVGNDRGILFRSGRVTDCAEALDWAMRHPRLMQEMAETAHQHVQYHYNWSEIVRDHLRIYQNLVTPPVPYRTPAQSLSRNT